MSVILKIEGKSRAARSFVAFAKTLSFVKVEEKDDNYNPEFVKKIKQAEKEEGRKMTSAEELWESI